MIKTPLSDKVSVTNISTFSVVFGENKTMISPLNALGGTRHLPREYSSNFIGSKCGYVKMTLWFLTDLFVLRLVFQVLLLCHVRLD